MFRTVLSVTSKASATLIAVGSFASVHAAIVTWDGSAGDGLWNTDANWTNDTTPDTKPGVGDTVFISDGSTVLFAANLSVPNLDITLSNNSTLNNNAGNLDMGAGITVTVESGSTVGGADTWRARNFVFDDGAIASSAFDFVIRDVYSPDFTFNLGETGFTTLTPRRMLAWSGFATDMPGATFAVDFENYNGGVQTIDLMDFGNALSLTDTQFQAATHSFTNLGDYEANLSFDETGDIIQLNITAVPEPSSAALIGLGAFALILRRKGLIAAKRRCLMANE